MHIARPVLAASAFAFVLLGGAGTALAHIEPDPAAVEVGTSVTVGFGIEHGCDGSPTTSVTFQIPAEVTDAQPVEKEGWTSTSIGPVVTFADGEVDADTPDTFSLTFTAPSDAGTIYFPVVQGCAEGETAWIEIATEGAEEPEHPAPALNVTAEAPTAEGETSTTEHDDHAEAESSDDDDSSSTGVIIAGVLAVAVIAGGVVFVRSRRNRS